MAMSFADSTKIVWYKKKKKTRINLLIQVINGKLVQLVLKTSKRLKGWACKGGRAWDSFQPTNQLEEDEERRYEEEKAEETSIVGRSFLLPLRHAEA